ncbi:Tyrosyl-tRNA synthetase [Hordeum vulgare]|nr:Tyrosyl-tRNA synthetase [Hordeum vulgare]
MTSPPTMASSPSDCKAPYPLDMQHLCRQEPQEKLPKLNSATSTSYYYYDFDTDFEIPFYGTQDLEEYLKWEHKMDTYLNLLLVSDKVVSMDDASIFGGESDDVPSSTFIHSDSYNMVEHGIFPSTTSAFGDELSDLCHHIESESVFTTSPIYDELPQFPCEESHNLHHLSEMSDATICPIHDDSLILDYFVPPLDKMMSMVEYDALPTWFHHDEDDHDLFFATSPTPHAWIEKGKTCESDALVPLVDID